jgi:hypothetical protein
VSENSDGEKHDLECMRLASDFIQLSRDTLNPELQAHCVKMAKYWSKQADGLKEKTPSRNDGSA